MSSSAKRQSLAQLLAAASDYEATDWSWVFTPRRVGRPRKFKAGQSLGDILARRPGKKRRRGRKTEISDRMYRRLLEDVVKTCEVRGYTGRGQIKQALTYLIDEFARSENISRQKARATHLGYFQARCSEAIRKFPELAEKLPK